jgi:hydroxyacylglutathione hydrolase
MTAQIVTIRCLTDNYAYLIHDPSTARTALIDAAEAGPVQAELVRRGWRLTDIFLTHHHDDHVQAVAALRGDARVIGNGADAHRLPPLDLTVAPGDVLDWAGQPVHVMRADGHTVGQVAYHVPALMALFPADSLMIHGCGRLFEGTPAQMQAAFDAFGALPDDTRIYSGHDYAAANLKFAAPYVDAAALTARLAELPQLAANGAPVTGTTLASERLLNPYFRVHLPQVKQAAGLPEGSDAAVFAEIRDRKNRA